MPRSDAAKKWEPDAFGKNMIDRITQFAVVSERSAEQLRLFDLSEIGPMWAHAQADFQSDPVKYPSVMAKKNDLEGRKQFQIKCQAICFPQKPPSDPKQCVSCHINLPSLPYNMTPQSYFDNFCSPGCHTKPINAGPRYAPI